MKRARLRLAAAIFVVLPFAVAAADTTADQAAALRTQLREWVENVFGPQAKVPDNLIEVAPQGDHFHVTVALGAFPDLKVAEGGTVSADVAPGPAGAWRIDSLRFASPTKLTLPAILSKRKPGPTQITSSYKTMQGQGVLDPSFNTPSKLTMKVEGSDVEAVNPGTQVHTQIDSLTADMGLTPTTPGRVDFSESATAANYSSEGKSENAPPFEMAAKEVATKFGVTSLATERVIPLVHALGALGESPAAGPKPPDPLTTPEGRKALRAAYLAFRGIATGAELKEALGGLRFVAAGHIVGLDRFGMGWRVTTPDGTLESQLALVLEGPSSDDIPPPVRSYLPHRLAITPSISGINLADLDALIMAATAPAPDHQEVNTRFAALMAHGVAVGLDTLAFNLGPADFLASGKLTAHSPTDIKGTATIRATGFDQLVRDSMNTPALAQAGPVLGIMRSLAAPDGDALVWNVKLDKNVVTVNGHDLQALLRPKPH